MNGLAFRISAPNGPWITALGLVVVIEVDGRSTYERRVRSGR